VDWRAKEWLALHVGWRRLALEFRNVRATLDMAISDPTIGATFRF